MDFLSNLKKHDQESNTNKNHSSDHKPTNYSSDHKPTNHSSDHKPTNSELLNSCKIVADAAKSQFGKQDKTETKYDKHKVASAAADILDAAGNYGKLDHQQGVGKYVEQAEEYLRKYGGHSPTTGGGSGQHHGGAAVPEKKGHGEGGGGSGDYMKMAQGFMHGGGKTESGGGHGGGGSADFMKMAGDFLKK